MDNINEIKNRITITDLLNRLHLETNKAGFIHSIYKTETKPSLKIYPETNSYFDFSSGEGGDIIKFYQDYNKIDIKQAIKELSNIAGIDSKTVRQHNSKEVKQQSTKPIKQPIVKTTKEHKKLYKDLYEFCERWVTKEHYNYLTGNERGLTTETIGQFKLFSISNYEIINKWLKDNYSKELLKSSGLVNEKGNLIFYKHSIIIPYIENKEIVYLRGRYFFNRSPVTADNKYIGLKGQPVKRFFNIDIVKNLLKDDIIFITEGEFDTILLTQLGFSAVGIPGANSFSEDMALQLLDFNITLLLDSDTAGIKASETIAEIFYRLGNRVKIKHLPKGFKDITTYLRDK